MKRVYLLISVLAIGGTTIAQTILNTNGDAAEKGIMTGVKLPVTGSSHEPKSTLDEWIEPVGDIMRTMGINETGQATGQSQSMFLKHIFQDSTVTYSTGSGTHAINYSLLGSVLDPKSSKLQSSLQPYVTATQPYSIDSIRLLGSYVKVTPAIDTLYTWLVWGDTTNSSVAFTKVNHTNFVAPVNGWRIEVIGPKVTGAVAGPGNVIKSSVPSSNRIIIKYVLTSADSTFTTSAGAGLKMINIPLPYSLNIPANNIVSCYYAFIPGGAYAAGAVSFSTGGATQTINGFCGLGWQQTSPVVTSLASYTNEQVDPDGWNMGIDYSKYQRHIKYGATSFWNTVAPGDQLVAPIIYYHITNAPIGFGITELENTNFSLSQNNPNPFINTTTINYELKTSVKSIQFQITDIAGAKIYEKTQANASAGKYAVEFNSQSLAAGIYFYSLTVDGNKITRKMIMEK